MVAPVELRAAGLGVQAFGADGLAAGRRIGGRPVLVIHGTMDRAAGFRRVQRRLADHPVVLYDRRGYATSRDAGLSVTIAEQVDDARAVVEATCDAPAVVVGHSLGGLISLHLAARHPDLVAGLVVWEAPMPWHEWYGESAGSTARNAVEAEGPDAAAEAFMRHIIGSELWDRLPAAMQAERRAEGDALIADLSLVRTPAARYEPMEVTVPVMAGCGAESPERFRRSAQTLAAEIDGAELVVVEGASHGVHLSDPGALAGMVRSLLARV